MLFAAFMVFVTGVLQTIKSAPTLEADTSLEGEVKILGEGNNSESTFWNESAIQLPANQQLCQGISEALFPDASQCDRYYRCHNGMTESYRCEKDYLFDYFKKKCLPRDNVTCGNETLKETPCQQQGDGLYPDHSSNCRQYYRCQNHLTLEAVTCPSGEAFSYHLQSCQPDITVTCVRPRCKAGLNGYFTLPGSKCQAYYSCFNGENFDFICPKGLIFNRESKSCVESGVCYEPICIGRINGNYADTTHDCTRSFSCRGGEVREVSTCPPGMKHNGRACVQAPFTHCDKPEKTAIAFYIADNDPCKTLNDGQYAIPYTKCHGYRSCLRGRTVATSQCPNGQTFNGLRCSFHAKCDDVCSGRANGKYVAESSNCQAYYMCFNGQLIHRKQCPNNTVFNDHACVSASTFNCAESSSRCVGLSDGYHPDYFNNCRGYFYCSNHNVAMVHSCLEETAWNGERCVPENEVVCRGPEIVPVCRGLQPGLYQDKASGCANYYYCSDNKGVLLRCSEGRIYDGDACVSTDEYTCPDSDRGICHNRADGYLQEENCRSYHYCSNGHKITYVCSDNYLFNGSRCVPPETYKCPFTSHDCVGKPNGYHADQTTGCRTYYYCNNEEKITSITCGGKKIFDGQKCVVAADQAKTCARASYNPCRHRTDGSYADEGCKKYFICANEIRIEKLLCPNETYFNGTDCVHGVGCSTESDSVCHEAKSGVFPDLNSNCTKFYFCVDRRKTLMSCPEGRIFDGRTCTLTEFYTCPQTVGR